MSCLSCLDISPFSLDLALIGAWTQNPNLSHLSHMHNQQEPWGNVPVPPGPSGLTEQPEAPQTCQAVSSACGAHRGWQGLSVCPQEMVSGQPFNCSSFTPRSFTPAEEGTNQHQPAPGPPLQFSFLQLLAGAGPSASPGAAKVLPRFSTLPPPGTASRPAGGTYLHALCVFLSERRGGR